MTGARGARPRSGTLPAQTRGLLRRAGLRARKGLGQHFLIDEGVLRLIVEAAELAPGDVVIEVGPGLGVLTRGLAEKAGRVVAVELDDRLAVLLREHLAALSNVTVVNGDILQIDPADLLREAGASDYRVVANLPYYITSPVLRHFLEASPRPTSMVVMVQKEVAETIAARPGEMSLLSVSVQFYGEPEIVSHVPAQCFYPAPDVDSAVLRIRVHAGPKVAVRDVDAFFGLVRAGFSASRKQMVNSLARGLGWPRSEVQALLKEAGIDEKRRAETLSLEEWARVWAVFDGMRKEAC